jgi:hypothetical protein
MTNKSINPEQTAGLPRANDALAARLRARARGCYLVASLVETQPEESRWSAFTRSFLARYRVLYREPRGVAMPLLQRSPMLQWLCQRWELAAYQLAPRIQLAINSMQSTAGPAREFASPRPSGGTTERIVRVVPSRLPGRLFAGGLKKAGVTPEQASTAQSSNSPLYQTGPPMYSPPRYQPNLSSRSTATEMHRFRQFEVRSEMVDRLVNSRHRIEEAPRAASAILQTSIRGGGPLSFQAANGAPRIYLAQSRMARVEEIPAEARRSAKYAPRNAAPASPIPAVNVEKLTDEVVRQLDRRLLAHRERIGKVF